MPIPMEYQHASEAFMRILAEARDESGLGTMNQSFTMVDGVLRTFRRRLTPEEALRFGQLLPPVLRALFLVEGALSDPPLPFAPRAELTQEVKALRQHHNFAPDTAIADVARVLRRHVDGPALDRLLADLSPGAADFWAASEEP